MQKILLALALVSFPVYSAQSAPPKRAGKPAAKHSKLAKSSVGRGPATVSELLPNEEEHTRRIFTAKKWSDVIKAIDGKMPANAVEEFRKLTADYPFPTVRRTQGKLVLSQSDGTRVVLEFKPDGVVSLNGKEWRMDPLETVDAQITQMALFLAGENAGERKFFSFIEVAQAAGLGNLAAAAGAHVAANAWENEACKADEMKDELTGRCALKAVPVKPIQISTSSYSPPEDMFPIAAKCPQTKSGTLEVWYRSETQANFRFKVTYSNGSPVKLSYSSGSEGQSIIEKRVEVDSGDGFPAEASSYVKRVLSYTNPVYEKACFGSKAKRERYFSYLKENLNKLKKQSSDDSTGEETSSLE